MVDVQNEAETAKAIRQIVTDAENEYQVSKQSWFSSIYFAVV